MWKWEELWTCDQQISVLSQALIHLSFILTIHQPTQASISIGIKNALDNMISKIPSNSRILNITDDLGTKGSLTKY